MKSTHVAIIAVLFLALVGAGLMLGGFFDDGTDPVLDDPGLRSRGENREPSESQKTTSPRTDQGGGIRTSKFTSSSAGTGVASRLDGDATGVVVRGDVVDPDGRPVADATVALIRDISQIKTRPQDGELLLEVQTGADGRFSFENLELGEIYIVRAMHPNFTTVRVHPIDPSASATLRQQIRLEVGIPMAGTIVSMDGSPVQDAEIAVYDLNVSSLDPRAEPERVATSVADGSYEVAHLKPGLKRVTVRKAGFATGGRNGLNLTSDENTKVDFTLDQGHTISGIIKDRRSQLPVEGALINARLVSMLAPQRTRPGSRTVDIDGGGTARRPLPARPGAANAFHAEVVASNSEGEFTLFGLQEARYILSVTCVGFQINNGKPADAGAQGISIEMTPSPRISGRVVDDETGAAVTAFEIATSTTPNPAVLPKRLRQRFQNENGEFTYVDVRPGTHYVIGRAPGYAGGRSESITVSAEEDRDGLVIRLVRGATMRGRVRNVSGQPVKGARISLVEPAAAGADPAGELFKKLIQQQMRATGGRTAVTDSKGNWAIGNVLSGDYSVKVEHTNYTDAATDPIACPDRGEVFAPEVVLKTGGMIRGTVRNEDGTPDGKATVMITSDDPKTPFNRSITTDTNGEFSLQGLKPGRYRVVVAQRNGQFDLMKILQSRNNPQAIVVVTEGETVEVNR